MPDQGVHSKRYLREHWRTRARQPKPTIDPETGLIDLRPTVADIVLWAAYPVGANVREFMVDCKHGTSRRRLLRADPRDNSGDGEIHSQMMTDHRRNIRLDPETMELCGCEPNVVAPS